MKVFLSSLENCSFAWEILRAMEDKGVGLKWNLICYYAIRMSPRKRELAERIRDESELVLVDSGAHSLQQGKCSLIDVDAYAREYADFIKWFDRPNVLGYFELDVDNQLGFRKVLELREAIKGRCGHPEKIIHVWHKNRGINQYLAECETCTSRIVGITGIEGKDIQRSQLGSFVEAAHGAGCSCHGLGVTRREVLQTVPFDYVDSSTWYRSVIFGNFDVRGLSRSSQVKVKRPRSREDRVRQAIIAYKQGILFQREMEDYWLIRQEKGGKRPENRS